MAKNQSSQEKIPSLVEPMLRRSTRPCAVTIAGSDSGAGAGIQADLRTFHRMGVHGTTAITCLTAQTPAGVTGVHPVPAAMVRAQLDALAADLPLSAAKTGMLYRTQTVRVVSQFLQDHPKLPVVIDPVMVATSGAVLLRPSAIQALARTLLPFATLSTPNLDEVRLLLPMPLHSLDDLRAAARHWVDQFQTPVLIKGGHLNTLDQAVDVFWDGSQELVLSVPRIRGVATHGTGCTYSAAIAAGLALGQTLVDSVQIAKQQITRAIEHSYRIGKFQALNVESMAPSGDNYQNL
jgi:hydroxymethylpyrimidine/phosphomethylpyrimidine kinase